MIFRASAYVDQLFDMKKLESIVQKSASAMKKFKKQLKFDAIAVRGVSGLSVGFPVSYITKIPLLVVRKPGDSAHTTYEVEGPATEVKRYIMLDDFICTGDTVRCMHDAITERAITVGALAPECVGVYCWNAGAFDSTIVSIDSKTVPVFHQKEVTVTY